MTNVPLRIGFENVPGRLEVMWLEVFVDVVFILDIVMNFRTGFQVGYP